MDQTFVVISGAEGKTLLVNLDQIAMVDVTDNGLDLHLAGGQRVFVLARAGKS